MIRTAIKTTAILSFLALFVVELSAPSLTLSGTCTGIGSGTSVPPFLGVYTVDPNILMVLDNSASMLDLAAAGAEGICYDGTYLDELGVEQETYDSTEDYGGYFRPYDATTDPPTLEDTFYVYDLNDGRFEKTDYTTAKANCTGAAGTEYYLGTDAASGTVCLSVVDAVSPNVITAFSARGNFLNWVASSKLDIQKKVLTGGKYDSANDEIILEGRGCLNHRYVKKIAVTDGTVTKYLTLGVIIPADWYDNTAYPANSVVVDRFTGTGYYTVAGGTSSGTGPTDDTGVAWVERDYADLTQIEIFEVTDTGFNAAACQEAIELMAAENPILGQIKLKIDECLEQTGAPTTLEADSNAIFNQTTQDCWFMTKHPDLWDEMAEGDTVATENMTNIRQGCENVYTGLDLLALNPTDIQSGDTGYACFGVQNPEQGYVGRCWDLGAGAGCVDDPCSGQPPSGAAEICVDRDPVDGTGEVYYCPGSYSPGQNECKIQGNVIPEADWPKRVTCVAGASAGWDPSFGGDNTLIDGCIQQAIEDYCGYFSTPEVIDPSDQEGSISGDYYNAPAILIEAAVEAQLDDPLLTMNGRIWETTAPEGILHENADKFRFGAMAFNDQGQSSECDPTGDENLLVDCEDKLDGAKVISYMDISDAHTTQLVDAINDLKGSTWTPLAEAMYTAIGYFSQDTSLRLNPSDFMIQSEVDAAAPAWANSTAYTAGDKVTDGGNTYIANETGNSCAACGGPETDDILWTEVALPTGAADPIEAYCQSNNVLFITEGASTVDASTDVGTFVGTNNDGADTDTNTCGRFQGSSWLDDLTYYAWQGNMWGSAAAVAAGKENYENIRTWVVEGAQRNIAGVTGECQPADLLDDTACNGSLIEGVCTDKFEAGSGEVQFRQDLSNAFLQILDRASSGSAASVVSASETGEGALYQAIFWPDTDSGRTENNEIVYIKWLGEVHALLVNAEGILHEDNDHSGSLSTGDTPVTIYYDTTLNRTRACSGTYDANAVAPDPKCGGTPGTVKELEEVQFLWNINDHLNNNYFERTIGSITTNRTTVGDVQQFTAPAAGADTAPRRFIFTWTDLDNDGAVDNAEDLGEIPGAGDEVLPLVENLGHTAAWLSDATKVHATRSPVAADFGIDPTDQYAAQRVNRIINWVRGQHQSEVVLDGPDGIPGTADDVTLPEMRSREYWNDVNGDTIIDPVTEVFQWKLGDVIHSTPITVAQPAENYHQIYRDESYAEFHAHYEHRRHVIYFGANDGMLHAVNGGFYTERDRQFCRKVDCSDAPNTPILGEELWAYVPYNLLPHLSCLTESDYEHKYFVDMRPRIFDVQIFPDDADHINGWGTILVGGMRFGGAEVLAIDEVSEGKDFDGDGDSTSLDKRVFASAYFVLDITNPEKLPVLLGEVTYTTEGDEDVDDDRVLDIDEDVDGDGNLDVLEPDIDGDGNFDVEEDLDFDGRLDTGEDINGNGVLDPSEDIDGDWRLDLYNEDVNGDGNLDRIHEDWNGNCVLEPWEDRDGDGNLDVGEDLNCNWVLDPGEDVNGNGFLDFTEDLDWDGNLDVAEDLDGDGVLFWGEDRDNDGVIDTNEDFDGDGIMDWNQEDRDGDGVLDLVEDLNCNGVFDLGEDLNGNGIFDLTEDRDWDGRLDTVDEDLNGDGLLSTINEDYNGNGVLDYFEDVDGDWNLDVIEDIDGDGNLDTFEDLDWDGNLDVPEDIDGDGNLDVAEDIDGDGNLDVAEDLDGDGNLDTVNEDVNGNGVLDPSEDIDGDGNLDVAEDVDGDGNLDVAEDLDGDGNLDTVNEDVDGDGNLDVAEDLDGDGNLDTVNEDVDGDGNLDVFEDTIIANGILDPGEDVDGDGNLDVAEDLDGDLNLDTVNEDVDGDGNLDVAEDLDGDFNLDTINEDIDGDGNLDVAEDLDGDFNLDVAEDTNGDGILTPAEDLDGDGNLDTVNEDIDGDGNLDVAEDVDGDGNLDVAEDIDGDGRLDTVNEDVDGDGYLDVGEDANSNGILDPGEDLNGNGWLDLFEDVDGDGKLDLVNEDKNGNGWIDWSEDVDGDGKLDLVNEDLDGDGILDVVEDSNGNGLIDQYEDWNCNGILDVDEDLDGDGWLDTIEDADSDGVLDLVDEDVDGDGNLDVIEDINGNGLVDEFEDWNCNNALDPGEDWDGDGVLDLVEVGPFCDWSYDPARDFNGNGSIDWIEDVDWDGKLDTAFEDLNGDGNLDVNEDLNGNGILDLTEDVNGNGVLDPGEDLDGDGNIDVFEDVNGNGWLDWGEDWDGDGVLDLVEVGPGCDWSYDPARDFNGNGVIDWNEDVDWDGVLGTVSEDLNGDGGWWPDIVEDTDGDGEIDYTEDWNWNGVLDFDEDIDNDWNLDVNEDLNGDGNLDRFEDVNGNCALDYYEDLDGDGNFDSVYEDVDGDGNLDVLEVDVDGDGNFDVEEDADGDGRLDANEDLNGNGVLDVELADLGYTTVIPTLVPMKDGDTTTWYLILGSGPTSTDGTSDQSGRLAVIPLDERLGDPANSMNLRIPVDLPVAAPTTVPDHLNDFGSIPIPDTESFISDLITVDLETLQNYKADVVYFGTVSGGWSADLIPPDGWGGKLYRLITRYDGNTGVFTDGSDQEVTRPYQWPTLLDFDPVGVNPNVLYDAEKPIVTPATVGTDGRDFWVYFGTGRFFDTADKDDVGSSEAQYFFGIREPINCGGGFGGLNWDDVPNPTQLGVPMAAGPDNSYTRGNIGLLPVENIAIKLWPNATENTTDVVGCYDPVTDPTVFIEDTDACFPTYGIPVPQVGVSGEGLLESVGYRTFNDLLDYILGDQPFCIAGTSPGFDGWSRELLTSKERNLGQATLLAGLTTYSTYIPSSDVCSQEGSGNLYGVYYQTGTPWVEDVFGRTPEAWEEPISTYMDLGAGLSTTPNIHVGEEKGGKAFIQTSVGQIVEIPQPNMPLKNIKTGRIKWMDIE
jgi:type IV pilus assembly protein PilY1